MKFSLFLTAFVATVLAAPLGSGSNAGAIIARAANTGSGAAVAAAKPKSSTKGNVGAFTGATKAFLGKSQTGDDRSRMQKAKDAWHGGKEAAFNKASNDPKNSAKAAQLKQQANAHNNRISAQGKNQAVAGKPQAIPAPPPSPKVKAQMEAQRQTQFSKDIQNQAKNLKPVTPQGQLPAPGPARPMVPAKDAGSMV